LISQANSGSNNNNISQSPTSESETVSELKSLLESVQAENIQLKNSLEESNYKLQSSEQKYQVLEKEQEELLMELAQYELQNS
jgi:hypothetical protein